MGIAELDEALTLVRMHSSDAHFAGPRDVGLIAAAEAALGVSFPPTYRRFLLELGAGSVGSVEIFGVINDDFEHSGIPDAIWYTLTERSETQLPHQLIVIYSLGDGEIFALDASHVNADGECPVVAWLPGGSEPEDRLEIISPDFGSFFLHMVKQALAKVALSQHEKP